MKIPYFSWLFLIPICSPFVSFGIFVVSGQCLSDQRSYLLQFKNGLKFNSTRSAKLVRWNESGDCCMWEGVTCSKEGRVIGLNLFNESITAGLDNSSSLLALYSLKYLENLNLAYNCFNSPIPTAFRKLKNLSYLNLSNACFAGQIPNAISSLTRLVTLDLSTLYILADSMLKLEDPNLAMLVQNLSELKELYLDGLNISVQGYEWCQALSSSLPNLIVLSMSDCYLSGPFESSLSKLQSPSIIHLHNNPFNTPVPDFFANFTNLTSLGLSSCGLNGAFPKKIFQIQTLQKLDLSHNDLLQGSLPEFLSNGSLRSLQLGLTNFSGTLPNSIGNLTMLSTIDLTSCNFSGSIPSSMGNLTQLVYLDMSLNIFTGPIPSFSMAKNMTDIILSHNGLTDKIHFLNWKDLLNLVNLDLGYNSLEGNIPVSLFSLPSLQTLQLSNNHFSGQLNEVSNASSCQLESLDLSSNYLEGSIPMSIFEIRGLRKLLLSSNNFNGSLQLNVIQQLRNLFNLDLSYNSLLIEYNGTSSPLFSFPQVSTLKLASCKLKVFPDFLINQSMLTILDLSHNQIHGEIPNWIWKFSNISVLDLSFNHLVMTREGPLLNLSSFAVLSVLNLHSNQLEGELPVLPPFATYLDFSENNFNSAIPASIGDSLAVAYFFSLSSNKFHGGIPQSLCTATYLQVLNLSNNTLNGTIPQCLIQMSKNLGVLDVRRNKLSGTISDIFPDNCGFQTLNLNGNLLEGVVPRSLANCRNLEVFDIGNNHIEDAFPCYLRSISKLRVLVLRSNKFYGSFDCGGTDINWPMLQIVDLASNKFSGQLQIKSFSTKAMLDDEYKNQPVLNHIQFEVLQFSQFYYQDAITVTSKGQDVELVKILTVFTSIDVSCNRLEGPIPEKIGELKLLYVLNLSHNSFTDSIPPSLGKLSHLESLDLSSNRLTGAIPMQLADGLTFLSVLNLSFNQLVGQIPQIKQFATFLETSYEGNKGLCGFPLNAECKYDEPGALPPTFEQTHSKSWIWTDWKNYISAELGFIFGFWVVIGPLVYWKRWRIQYYKHIDDILIKIFPQLNL